MTAKFQPPLKCLGQLWVGSSDLSLTPCRCQLPTTVQFQESRETTRVFIHVVRLVMVQIFLSKYNLLIKQLENKTIGEMDYFLDVY
jgi:hypothetical protein